MDNQGVLAVYNYCLDTLLQKEIDSTANRQTQTLILKDCGMGERCGDFRLFDSGEINLNLDIDDKPANDFLVGSRSLVSY